MPGADAADLVRRMAGRYRLPDALRRADTLAQAGPPAATTAGRQPHWPNRTRDMRISSIKLLTGHVSAPYQGMQVGLVWISDANREPAFVNVIAAI